MRWYHEGINAFERTCPAGLTLFEFFEADLLSCVAAPQQKQAVDDLLSATQAKTEQVLLELQQGRDRLLELNSFNEQRAEEIVHDLVSEERRKELATYMEQVFDQYGVDQEHLSAHSLILKPGDHMLVDGFPALPEDGMTATFRREEALSREDMQFLNWEHPMVSGAMDLLIHGEFGNTALCTLKLPPIKAGSILLEAMFTLSCTAPAELQLGRYLPLTTIRLIVDHRDNDLSSILSHSLINKLSRKVPRAKARDIVRHTRPKITGMIKFAESLADTQKTPILESALSQMKSSQQAELDRLEALAEKNPNIRQEEIEMLQTRMGRLQTHLQEAQVRLDAIRVIVASE
jgi:ATP-dependent helicase HepA